jgi:hypothetical protein
MRTLVVLGGVPGAAALEVAVQKREAEADASLESAAVTSARPVTGAVAYFTTRRQQETTDVQLIATAYATATTLVLYRAYGRGADQSW